jgi:serine/threonine protein phosphatase PrpC
MKRGAKEKRRSVRSRGSFASSIAGNKSHLQSANSGDCRLILAEEEMRGTDEKRT